MDFSLAPLAWFEPQEEPEVGQLKYVAPHDKIHGTTTISAQIVKKTEGRLNFVIERTRRY